jgi:alkylation response protein AidB-like acyl-CoA dehydrogenase
MDFDLTDDQRTLRERVRAWRDRHEADLRDHARRGEFPAHLYREGMEEGFGNVIVPEEFGGQGGGAVEYAIVAQEVGIFQISIQVQRALLATGSERQKGEHLPGLAAGESVPAISISEPETGSSLKSMDTTAEKRGDHYVLDGTKSHVNLAAEADLHKVYAMADEGLTVFLVEDDNEGITVTQEGDPIGTRYLPIYDLELDDCVVHESQTLLEPGAGYEVFFETFNFSRIGNASEMLGHGWRALEAAIRWADRRQVGDDVVTDFQGIRWKAAELYTALSAAERLRDEAACRIDAGHDSVLETSMAKLAAANAAAPATTEAMQITGAHGLYYEQPFVQHFLDVKTLEIAGGSREIMKNVIADRVVDELAGGDGDDR